MLEFHPVIAFTGRDRAPAKSLFPPTPSIWPRLQYGPGHSFSGVEDKYERGRVNVVGLDTNYRKYLSYGRVRNRRASCGKFACRRMQQMYAQWGRRAEDALERWFVGINRAMIVIVPVVWLSMAVLIIGYAIVLTGKAAAR
jgi:hypothetical protein